MITIKDIAREVGVSYSTVSRALNGLPGTHPETRERILRMAKQLGYEPNALARSLVKNQSDILGFVVPDLSNPFFTSILQAAEREANLHGFQLLISETRWQLKKEEVGLKTLLEKRVEGIFLYPVDRQSELAFPGLFRIPHVLVGESSSPEAAKGAPHVEVNNRHGARLAVEHLAKSGCRNLAYIGGPEQSASNQIRLEGFRESLRHFDLEERAEWVLQGSYSIENGYEQTKRLLAHATADREKGLRPDAIICANDLIALGALQYLSEAEVRVPEEVSVVGFDDVRYASLPQIQLTTVRIPCEDIGSMGTRLLIGQVNAKRAEEEQKVENQASFRRSPRSAEQEGEVPVRVVLEPQLIIRRTTRRQS